MFAATGYDLVKELHASKVAGAVADSATHVTMNGQRWIVLAIGFVISFVVAFGVVEWFLAWVRKHGFAIFAIYRILIGIVLLVWGTRFIGAQ